MRLTVKTGFTLSELLVGLGIIGLIAAFAVPKVLNASGAAVANAKVHKAAQAVVNGYEKWVQENGNSENTTPANIMSIVQHNGLITDGRKMDFAPSYTEDFTCTDIPSHTTFTGICYKMPDGAVLFFRSGIYDTFGQNPDKALFFAVDPDGFNINDNSQANNSNATAFWLYSNGRLRERGRLKILHASQPQYTPNYYRQ